MNNIINESPIEMMQNVKLDVILLMNILLDRGYEKELNRMIDKEIKVHSRIKDIGCSNDMKSMPDFIDRFVGIVLLCDMFLGKEYDKACRKSKSKGFLIEIHKFAKRKNIMK